MRTITMAHDFCENHRTFDRFSSRAKSLQRLGYEPPDINRLLADTKEEFRRDNIHRYQEQVFPYHCEDECQICIEAYEARRKARFSQTVQAFADLYVGRGWLEFQHLTVAPFAPKPAHVHDVLHDTPETEQVYQGWLDEYLSDRVAEAYESLRKCIERWREEGRRVVSPLRNLAGDIVYEKDQDGKPDKSRPCFPELPLREYEDRPIRLSRRALRSLPEEVLSRQDIQRIYGIITNEFKREFKDEVAMERGFENADAMLSFAREQYGAKSEPFLRLKELLSAIALEQLRECKNRGDFSERVKAWFARAGQSARVKIESDIGFVGGLISQRLSEEIQAAWLHSCWHEGWMQACVKNRRVYIPLERERRVKIKVERGGRTFKKPVIRQEYSANVEPGLAFCESLPEEIPDSAIYRVPRVVLTEMLGLYRRRCRRDTKDMPGLKFKYIQVEESGKSDEHHHVHAITGFDVHAMPVGASSPVAAAVVSARKAIRNRMQLAWHQVSGNIIWKRGNWSTAVRRPERAGTYMGKYLSKERGRTTWVSHNLNLKEYNRGRRFVDLGLLPARPPVVDHDKKAGCFRFGETFTEYEMDRVGVDEWVGLSKVGGVRLKRQVIPDHVRVDAVARSSQCPSLGTAAGAVCFHRTRGIVNVMPRVDLWLPVRVFYSLIQDGLRSAAPVVRRLFLGLSIATGRVPKDFVDHQHDQGYHVAHRLQARFGQKAFHKMHEDYELLLDRLISHLESSQARAP